MQTRRAFLIQSLAASLALAAKPAQARAQDDLWLNRLTFGATPEARVRFAELGPMAWLEEQIALPDTPDLTARFDRARLRITYPAGEDGTGTWAARDDLRPLTFLTAPPEAALPLLDWTKAMDYAERIRPAEEVIASSLIRAVHSPAQLREVMTQFWHDHFNVHAEKDEFTAAFFPAHDALLRQGALGNFRDLLGAVARSPSMLVYLNNADSRASPANENFARELLELHTLGAGNYLNDRFARWHEVPKENGIATGYIDEDVYEVARAFTGWTLGDGRYLSEGVEAPRSGQFHYASAWHDPYQKRILGVEFPPNRADLADGEQVLDILAHHPGTARFLCTKLARRLLADDPDPGLIDRLTRVWITEAKAPDQVAQVLRALVTDPAFAAPPSKLRRPFEFLVALYRASGAEITGTENAHAWQLARAGWHPHGFAPPTGPSDRAEDWQSSTTLLRLVDYALEAHAPWFGVTETRLTPTGARTLGDLVAHWSQALGVPADLGDLYAASGMSPADPVPEGDEASQLILAFLALTPDFLFR